MLILLRIQNIILIEETQIAFEKGLNVLSGETGSGKSAIMNSLNLISGERADTSLIRHGANKASIEALFDLSKNSIVYSLLEESGIDYSHDEELIIRREISSEGKGRCFVNNQPVQQAFLKKISNHLFEIAGQHANQKLLSIDKHREILDIYGDLENDVRTFSKSWSEQSTLESHLEQLIGSESKRLRDIEICLMELEELNEAKLKEGEDEELFAEYTLLANSDDLSSKVKEILSVLTGDRVPVVTLLNRQRANFDQLVKMDQSLAETAKCFANSIIELQEVAYTLQCYSGNIEFNPMRLDELNNRLALINRLKRKYGSTIQEINQYKKESETKLKSLESVDTQIEDIKIRLAELKQKNDRLAQELTNKRKKSAQKLEKELVAELRSLNMPKVEFHCNLAEQKRTKLGDDKIEFYLSPNVGEKQIPIRECASGGELSRVMLALQALLAGKEDVPTLIFDEIDANIGGETASIVGEKLKEIAAKHQVLCITHFSQVAKQAHHHLQVSKQEKDQRTFSTVKTLNKQERQRELVRMQGG